MLKLKGSGELSEMKVRQEPNASSILWITRVIVFS
jgi:hypothetical protein